MSRESKIILGGLTPAQVNALPKAVREARAAYISDSGAQLDHLFNNGVTELRNDDPDKDDWALSRRQRQSTHSLDYLLEMGYQVDQDGAIIPPDESEG